MFSQLHLPSVTLILTMSIGALTPNLIASKAQAQHASNQLHFHNEQLANRFQAPSGSSSRGAIGGGTRGNHTACVTGEKKPELPLTLLLPESQFGLTVRQYPQFFVYVPESQGAEAEFVLREVDGDYEYRTSYTLPQTGGIVTLELPRTEAALEVGKKYEWIFVIVCDIEDRDKDVLGMGIIQPTELSPTQKSQIDQADPLERAGLYAEYGIWHDAVSTLATLQCFDRNNPNILKSWQELLTSESVKLDAVVSQPFVECNTANVSR